MPGRSSSKNRCDRCRMYGPLCLCAEIPRFQLRTRIVVLMHWRERKLTTNTASLACLALPNSAIHLRGRLEAPVDMNALVPSDGNAALLYPTEDAVELNEEWVKQLTSPLTLIVPDGSWRQARKVSLREKSLENIPKLKLPIGPPSSYRLRHSIFEENLSTFEAIARAIGILENKEIQASLEGLFLKMVERTLWSRGVLSPSKCSTGIPYEAILASHIAGAAGGKKMLG